MNYPNFFPLFFALFLVPPLANVVIFSISRYCTHPPALKDTKIILHIQIKTMTICRIWHDLRYRQRYCSFLANTAIEFTIVNNMGVTRCHIIIAQSSFGENKACQQTHMSPSFILLHYYSCLKVGECVSSYYDRGCDFQRIRI